LFAITELPAVNATLNALATLFLVFGYIQIKRGNWQIHKRLMLCAMTTSTIFLISYLIYHFNIGSKPFPGLGIVRIIYFVILISHVVLAVTILPLALITVARGLRGQNDRHRRIARVTLPLWLYVSVTGIVVYLMLYQLY
jgi:uncharacterized membrane protein YozB (DUF420 family)